MKQKQSPFFYGWIIMLACVGLCGSITGLIGYSTGLFAQSVTDSLAIDMSAYYLHSTIMLLSAVVILPFVDALYQRYSLKRIMLIGVLCGGIALFAFSMASHIFVFYAMSLLLGICMAFSCDIAIVCILSNWFIKKRAFATSMAFSGSGIAMMCFSPLITTIIQDYGWRFAYRALAVLFLLFTVPSILFLIKKTPEEIGLKAYGAQSTPSAAHGAQPEHGATGFTRAQAFKTKSFWLFSLAIFLISMYSTGSLQHLVSYWVASGFDAQHAALCYSAVMGVSILSKPLLGIVYDKYSMNKATCMIIAVCCLSFLCLHGVQTGVSPSISAVLIGLSISIQIVPPTYMTNKLFGSKEYASIISIILILISTGASVGALVCAKYFDLFGSYDGIWLIFVGLILLSGCLLLLSNHLSIKEHLSVLGYERPL